MALKLDFNFRGIPVKGAYAVVTHMGFSPLKDTHYFTLTYYAAKGAPELHSEGYIGPYCITGQNPFDQAYTFLKGLSEFTDSIDC